MRAQLIRIGTSLVAMTAASPAWACTLCHSRTAEDVRAAILGPDLWSNLGALAAPLPLLVAAVALVRRLSP